MLPVRATRQQRILGSLGQPGEVGQHGRELSQEDLVRAAHLEELAGLRDVLGRGAPVHVAARIALVRAIELPDQRHQRMTGLREPRPHGGEIEILQLRLGDRL